MKKQYLVLITYAIFLFGAALRLYNLNWDSGYHMHPDERAIILSVIKLAPPTSLQQFLSPDSPWNPKFFAYGSLPFYLLRLTGDIAGMVNPLLAQYDGINLVGRLLSALFDIGTLFLIFLLAKRLFVKSFALLAVFFYAISTLPVQLSHFYAVDTPLTFFITATLYLLLGYLKKPSGTLIFIIGSTVAAALATKLSAAVIFLPVGVTFAMVLLQHKQSHYKDSTFSLSKLLFHLGILGVTTIAIYALCQPYTFLDFPTFAAQTREQSQLTRDAFAFPYTLQYVRKIPYVYELKNIIFYGLGPILSFFSLAGLLLWTVTTFKKPQTEKSQASLVLLSFFWIYFLIVGSFAVGFMRYLLPLYPLLALAALYFFSQAIPLFLPLKKLPAWGIVVGASLFALSLLVWPLSFLQIYTKPNTRVTATAWINEHIPPGSTIAIEHWDDALPLTGQEQYRTLTLTLYDQDTPEKWQLVRDELKQTDYLILASNRLYTPLMKLTNCRSLPPGRCYRETAAYYEKLFSGSLGFVPIADITSYPTIPFTAFHLPDQTADESFTVYDHPRILIFKKMH